MKHRIVFYACDVNGGGARRGTMAYRRTSRSERVRAASRAKILRAASRLFVKNGYQHTTMQDVVRSARTSIGNLYFYFPNKEQLVWAVLEDSATAAWEWTDEAVESVAPGPPRLAVMVFANATGLLGFEQRLTHLLLTGEFAASLRARVLDRYAARVRGFLAANLPGLTTEQLARSAAAWLGAGRSLLEARLTGQVTGGPVEMAEFIVRWNLRGLGVPEGAIDQAIAVAHDVMAKRTTDETDR